MNLSAIPVVVAVVTGGPVVVVVPGGPVVVVVPGGLVVVTATLSVFMK